MLNHSSLTIGCVGPANWSRPRNQPVKWIAAVPARIALAIHRNVRALGISLFPPAEHARERLDRGSLVTSPFRVRYGKEFGSGGDQRRGIARRDAADRDAGQLEHGRPPAQQHRPGMMADRLGRGRVEGAEGDIVRPRLARFHREVAAVVTGHADLRLGAENRTRLARIAVVLAEMDTVRAEALGQRDAVVDDERHLAVGADALQRLGERRGLVLADVLDAELERRDRPGIERADEPVGEAAGHVERRDEIELARRPALVAREGDREVRVERAEGIVVGHGCTTARRNPSHFFAPTVCTAVADRRGSAATASHRRRAPSMRSSSPEVSSTPPSRSTLATTIGVPGRDWASAALRLATLPGLSASMNTRSNGAAPAAI